MRIARHLLLALFFLGLVALEIAHGTYRLDMIRERRRREALAGIEAGHGELARAVRENLELAREHAAYLALVPAVRDVLTGSGAEERRAPKSDILPYIRSFRGIDRVRILDPEGIERFRCERIGKGAGAIPAALLEREPDARMVALTREAPPGEVSLSDLVMDSGRVEVPESDRQVLHFATRIEERAAAGPRPIGVLVLTVYAAPLLNGVRRFAPVPGVASVLVDEAGDYLASPARSRERGSPGSANLAQDYPGCAAAILAGEERASAAGVLLLSSAALDARRPWRVVTAVPEAALDAASGHARGEYSWVIGSVAVKALILLAAGAFLVRMSVREFRLRELARFQERQRELERQVQITERLGSLGLLTAGVAHEINNPLEGIENYLALLEREQGSPERRKKYVEMVRYGFHRIRDIVRDLSSFARPSVTGGVAEIDKVVRQALRLVSYSKDFKGVKVHLEGLDGPLHVTGDSGRLEQVFINLLLNAARALGGTGNIFIRAREAAGGPDAPAGIEVVVEDDGPGIPPEVLGRVFDPFFTTTGGTGLGLSISYGILRAHGGSISAQNRDEGGARFVLRLPPALAAGAGTGRA